MRASAKQLAQIAKERDEALAILDELCQKFSLDRYTGEVEEILRCKSAEEANEQFGWEEAIYWSAAALLKRTRKSR